MHQTGNTAILLNFLWTNFFTLKGNETGANGKNESKETLEANMTNNSALKFCNPGISTSHKAVSMYCKAFYSNSHLANELTHVEQR